MGYNGCKAPWRLEDCGPERMITTQRWHNLDQQTVVLLRGADLLVVSAARVPGALGPLEELEAALALGRPADLEVGLVPVRIDEERVLRARTQVEPAEYLASIEVVGADQVGRARLGIPAPPLADGFGISDLALVHPLFEAGDLTLEEALLPSVELPADRLAGIYFEIYGLGPQEEVEFSLGVEHLDPGILQRTARALGIGTFIPAEVTWEEPGGEGAAITRQFYNFDLSNLEGGEYTLTLTARTGEGREATASREIRVR
jgi:hypothetical protein